MPRYYASPDGLSFATTGDGPIAGPSLPDDWTEITAEEYTERTTDARAAADANADAFLAADGEMPPPPEGTPPPVLPISDLLTRGTAAARAVAAPAKKPTRRA